MKAHLSRRYLFSASHRLHSADMSPDENRSTYGKCNNPHGHGHNYRIEVTVAGPIDPETGMVVNMADLDSVVRKQILDRFDHTNLNLDPLFSSQVPTTENFCIAVFDLLSEALKPSVLDRVRIEETENNSFEYAGG